MYTQLYPCKIVQVYFSITFFHFFVFGMITDVASSENSAKKRTRRFEYTARYKTLEQKISYDAEIPLTDEYPIDEIISHIYVTNKVLPVFYKG